MRIHKPTGKAYVYHAGKMHYLGPWNTPETRRAYREWIARWETVHAAKTGPDLPRVHTVTVGELVAAHAVFAEKQYRRVDGEKTDEIRAFRTSLAPLVKFHAHRSVEEILPRDVREIVDAWESAKLSRKTINKMLGRIKRVFNWGVQEEFVTDAAAFRVSKVKGLPIGRGVETDEVQPVPLRDLARTLKVLSPRLAAMARVQYYCGARPGEVCRMRADEILKGSFRVQGRTVAIPDGLWVWIPEISKVMKAGHIVYYTLGPRAQKVLQPFIDGARDGWLFYGQTRDYIREDYYATLIGKACERAGAGHWSPGRLRHNFMTRWDAAVGIEQASAAVRHKHLSTTAIYIQRDLKRVGESARKLG
jgi:integrase